MKKTISVFLAVIIVVSTFITTAIGADNNVQDLNLLINGDFSNDSNFDTNTTNYKGGDDGLGKWINIATGVKNFEYTANEGMNGSGAVKSTVSAPNYYIRTFGQAVMVEKNTDYIITFKFKGNIGGKINAGAFKIYTHAIKDNCVSEDSYVVLEASEDWIEYTVKFNTGNNNKIYVGFGGMDNGKAGDYYLIDDVSLYKADMVAIVNLSAEEGGSVAGGGYYAENTKATITAIPNVGYDFDGWYLNGQKIYDTPTAIVDAKKENQALIYTARFIKKVTDLNELIYDGGFDLTSKVASAEGAATVTYESAHIWYKPSTSSAVENDGENKVLNLKSWIYQSVKISENTSYVLKFKAKNASTDLKINVYLRNLRNRSETLFYQKTETIIAGSDWKEYSLVIDVQNFLANVTDYALGLQAGDGNSVLLDDISLKKIENYRVTAVAQNGGTATVSKELANDGEVVTFKAEPSKNYKFIGWFRENEGVALSTDAVYDLTVTGDITLIAKFDLDIETDPDELIFDGGFEFSNSVANAESYDSVTYESAHIWYKPSTSSAIESDGDNKALNLKCLIYQSVKVTENTTYILKFKAKKASTDLKINVYLRNLRDRNETLVFEKSPTISVGEDWKEYSVIFSVNNLLENATDYALGLHCGDGNSVLLDDISLKEIDADFLSAEVTTMRGGTATMEPPTVVLGGQVTFTAFPDEGNEFVGWYLAGATNKGPISTERIFTTVITENINLIAIFGGDKYPDNTYNWQNGNAETGNTDGWVNIYGKDSLSVTTDNVCEGDYSFLLTKEDENRRPTMVTKDGILLKGGHKYTISCNLRSYNTYVRPFLSTSSEYQEGKTDFVYSSETINIRDDMYIYHTIADLLPEKRKYSSILFSNYTNIYASVNGWVNYTMTFEVPHSYDGTVVYFGLQCRSGVGEAMLDNLTVVEEELDFTTQKSHKLYGEWLYNLFENGGFERKNTGDFTDLPKGFELSNTNSCEGENHIKVNANSGVYVKKLNLTKNQWYHLNYYIKSNTSGNSYIGISFVKPKDNADFSNPSELEITAFYHNATSKWHRDGIKFYTSNTMAEVYLIIYSGSNAFEIDDLSLFAEKTAREQNPNNPSLLPEYDYEGDGILRDKYDILYNNIQNGVGYDPSTSPTTGDSSYSAIIMAVVLMLSSFIAIFVTKSKRRLK